MSENDIKPVAWVECNANGHDRMWSYSLESWANRPANPEPLYDQSAIDALTKQISELKTMLSIAEFQRKEMQAERDEANRKLSVAVADGKALVADAERYRWLKRASKAEYLIARGVFGLDDAAIDAARAQEGQA